MNIDFNNPREVNKYLCELESEYQTAVENGISFSELSDLYSDMQTLNMQLEILWNHSDYESNSELWDEYFDYESERYEEYLIASNYGF